MRPSDAAGRVALAAAALESIETKGHLGPNIGTGRNSIGAAAARARGIIVDENGRLRCPPTAGDAAGEYTDMDMSNCALGTVAEVARDTVRKLSDIPQGMSRFRRLGARYRPTRKTRRAKGTPTDRDSATVYWGDRLSDGLPLEAVPDEFLWDSISHSSRNSDRFEINRLSDDAVLDAEGNEAVSGINQVAMITDTKTGQQMFVKGEEFQPDAPQAEFMAHLIAHELGLPVGEFRAANGGQRWKDLLTIQTHVGGHVSGEIVKPVESPGSEFDMVETFGEIKRLDLDNVATMTMFDWLIANGDRHAGNMFVARDAGGVVHVVPIDHGFAIDPFYDRGDSPKDFMLWATHEETDGVQSAGFAFLLVDQEVNGLAKRDDILDAFESARERIANLQVDDIDRAVMDMLPDGYVMDDYNAKRDMIRRRIEILSQINRKELSNMLDRIQSGEATRTGPQHVKPDVKYYKPGVIVPNDISVYGMDDWQHGVRQPNGTLVRGVPMSHSDPAVPDVMYVTLPFGEDKRSGGTITAADNVAPKFGWQPHPLHASIESANQWAADMALYQKLSVAWRDDDYDAAKKLILGQAEKDGFEVATESKFAEYWNGDKPFAIMNMFWYARKSHSGQPVPELSDKYDDFIAAASWEPLGTAEVRRSDLNPNVMLTLNNGKFNFHGDMVHRRIRRRPISEKKASVPEGVSPQPERRQLDVATPEDLTSIHDTFKQNDRKLMLVGGAVRDTLLGREPKDFDLATDAPPDEVIAMLEKDPNLTIDLTGADFAVVRVKTPDGNEYEIATFRTDVGEGRRPDAVELATIEEDVARRDLTMNALFYDLDSREVVDYVGGMADIENGVVRSVGNPEDRFREDPLRILRALRFSGRTGFDLDDATKEAIRKDTGLAGVSPERVHDEFLSGLKSAVDNESFIKLIDELDDNGSLWSKILGEGIAVDPTAIADSKNGAVQIAALVAANDLDSVESALKKMKYTNDEISDVKFLQRLAIIDPDSAPKMKKDWKNRDLNEDDLRAFAETIGLDRNELDAFLEFVETPPAMSSDEAIAQGLKGPEIGRALAEAEADAFRNLLSRLR